MGIKGPGGLMVPLGPGGGGLPSMSFIFLSTILLRSSTTARNSSSRGLESEPEHADNIHRHRKSCNEIIIGFSFKIVNVFELSTNKSRLKLKLWFNHKKFSDLPWKTASKTTTNFRHSILTFYYAQPSRIPRTSPLLV